MKKSLVALVVLSFATSAFAGEKINVRTEKVPTFKAENIHNQKNQYSIYHQVAFKNGSVGKVNVLETEWSERPATFEHEAHAVAAQARLMRNLEEMKLRHNEEHFQSPDKQIEHVTSWLENNIEHWTTIKRVGE